MTDREMGGLETDAETMDDKATFSRDAKPWLAAIKEAQTYFAFYFERAANIDKLFASLKERAKNDRADREFQIFWANLEVLKPSIYARPPAPVVVPSFRDRRELPTKASEVLERTLVASFRQQDIDATMKHVRDDMAVAARGVVWLRYEDEEGEGKALNQCVYYDHLDRKDFLHEPARKWSEVGWVARRAFMTRTEGVERFGDAFLKCTFQEIRDQSDNKFSSEQKAEVWEIWSKTDGCVAFVSPGVDEVLEIREPWIALEKFFPCPRPAYGTIERGSLIPIPDFLCYRDQVDKINELTARISALSESLRLKGFYQAGDSSVAEAIERAFRSTDDGAILVPVSSAAIMAGASFKDAIVWLPVSDVAVVIKELIANRKQLIDDVYQITSLSDIMRGATQASETATAQQLKAQYGSVRVRDRQEELVRLARDITRMAGEIMAENFTAETFLAMSQSDMPMRAEVDQRYAVIQQQAQAQGQPVPPPPKITTLDDVVALFQNEKMRPFVLDIETDSTIQPDEDAEKQRRTEFLTAIGGFIQQAFPLVQALPQAAPFAAACLKFAAAGFRAGRELDSVIDQFADGIEQMAQQHAQQQASPPPDPKAEKAKADMAIAQQKGQLDIALKQIELQIKQAEAQSKLAPQGDAGPSPVDQRKTLAEIEKLQAETAKLWGEAAALPAEKAQSIAHAERRMDAEQMQEPALS